MRVIAGSARRIGLVTPNDKVRPTTDRTKETLFNIIQNDIVERKILDLFAGSGALGIEALSRGGSSAVFCDSYVESIQCTKNNLQKTKLIEKAEVFQYDYVKACQVLSDRGHQFDLIFLDPPYNNDYEMKALELIDQLQLLSEDGLIVVESSLETSIRETEHFEISRIKEYKTNKFTLVRKKEL